MGTFSKANSKVHQRSSMTGQKFFAKFQVYKFKDDLENRSFVPV